MKPQGVACCAIIRCFQTTAFCSQRAPEAAAPIRGRSRDRPIDHQRENQHNAQEARRRRAQQGGRLPFSGNPSALGRNGTHPSRSGFHIARSAGRRPRRAHAQAFRFARLGQLGGRLRLAKRCPSRRPAFGRTSSRERGDLVRVLVDTDVWLDVALGRDGHDASLAALYGCIDDGIIMTAAATTLRDAFTIASAADGSTIAYEMLERLLAGDTFRRKHRMP